MSDSQELPWSDHPNAPNISHPIYLAEKTTFARSLIASILYGMSKTPRLHVRLSVNILFLWFVLGIVIVLSFQSMAALFDPVHRRGEGIRWGLVSFTAVMFLLATIQTALDLDIQSISYIDNRAFSGIGDGISPGPLGYQVFISADALAIVPNIMFALSSWLADGLLVSSLFGIAIPCPTKLLLSSIVAILSTSRTSGSSPSPASCTSVLWVRVYVLHELSVTLKANRRQYSDGYNVHLPVHGIGRRPVGLPSILYDFTFIQYPPHPDDHHPAHPVRQEHSDSHGGNRKRSTVQCHRHHDQRVLYH